MMVKRAAWIDCVGLLKTKTYASAHLRLWAFTLQVLSPIGCMMTITTLPSSRLQPYLYHDLRMISVNVRLAEI